MGFTFLFLIGTHVFVLAQNTTELNRRNGFKTIKLASPIDSVRDVILKKEFMERDEFPARLYQTENPEYKFIGEVAVKEVQLMTYRNLIFKIVVTTEKDPRLMKALEKSFGKAVYVVRTTSYNWKADNMSLTFIAHKNSIDLIYRSYPVIKMMNEDKGKKIDAIAEDF